MLHQVDRILIARVLRSVNFPHLAKKACEIWGTQSWLKDTELLPQLQRRATIGSRRDVLEDNLRSMRPRPEPGSYKRRLADRMGRFQRGERKSAPQCRTMPRRRQQCL